MKSKKRIRKPRTRSTSHTNGKGGRKLTFHKLDWLEWIAIGVSIWFFVFPYPYKPLFVIMLGLPIFGLFLNGLAGRPSIASLVEITKDKDGSNKYDVADFIDFPAIVLFIHVLRNYEFESFYSLIIPGVLASLMMLVLVLITHKIQIQSAADKLWIYCSFFFNVCLFSFAATYGVNCVFDDSEPEVYYTEVLDKHISRGRRSTSYYVKVAPWGHHHDIEKISVSYSQYNALQPGELVEIDRQEGLFHIPWYYINK
ncbi:hypothetical protein [Aridibaculum aurantiacum]|uniref:hypothetical protein n=1 Tax=Aridibaculum aurantiacum TaxID=2810307 RepID=UPI001A9797DB|nr:hypothetical protein [Aridibaculum aurantiacum]